MNSYPEGEGPDCPTCPTRGRIPPFKILTKGITRCRECWREDVKTAAVERRAKAAGLTVVSQPAPQPAEAVREPLASFEEAWAQWQQTIGMMRDRYAGPPKVRRDPGDEKIVVIPDIHAPYHEPRMLAELIAREPDADRAICMGDISDAYALSRFVKYDWMPFREEWASVTAVMQAISEAFPKVDVIVGNHDARAEKQIRTHLSQDMVDAIRFMTGGTLCPLTALAKRYENVSVASHETPDGHAIDWFTTVGDAWLGHPEKFSRVPGSTLRSVEEWLADNEAHLGLDRYRLIVVAHTHQLCKMPWRAGQMLVECGCLCKTQGYQTSPRIGGRPQKRGYITFHQRDGRTDLNSVNDFWFDVSETAA